MADAKFLIVRLGSLGDIVHTFPAVAALRETFSSAKIVWLTHPRWRELVAASGIANEIWEVETRSFASVREVLGKIRRENFSAAIDYQGLWKSAALPFLARVPRRIGFSPSSVREAGVPLLYTDRIDAHAKHVAGKNGELSLAAGAAKPIGAFALAIPVEAKATVENLLREKGIQKYVVLSPGGGWVSKCWPPERFGELARRLFDECGIRSLINCGPGEEILAQRVVDSAGPAAAFSCGGSFGELMAILKRAEFVVAGDTGPLHLADALGARVVAIFGPTDPERNGPYWGQRASGKAIVLRAKNVVSTYKRDDEPHPSLLEISVDDVFLAMSGARTIS
ncbi:MAG TPA: glycosyltransferase family 9 protein [Candidatus Acidoferrum sp.]|nr:glycosyltransferase family 9 protein [Candidatus Acidoferrum sp.]